MLTTGQIHRRSSKIVVSCMRGCEPCVAPQLRCDSHSVAAGCPRSSLEHRPPDGPAILMDGAARSAKRLKPSPPAAADIDGLVASAKQTGDSNQVLVQHNKFASASGSFELAFHPLPVFFSGLEQLIGSANPNLLGTMRHEHCTSADSQAAFVTGNYGIKTTSEAPASSEF